MSKHRRTLEAIFAAPVRASIKWRDIESLLKHEGATITEGEGSRVNILLRGRVITMHRPHPSPDADKGAVRDIRDFLTSVGIKP